MVRDQIYRSAFDSMLSGGTYTIQMGNSGVGNGTVRYLGSTELKKTQLPILFMNRESPKTVFNMKTLKLSFLRYNNLIFTVGRLEM